MTNKIIVIGSCNTDMTVKSERIPVPGETILGGRFLMNPGGKGANQAVAAARLGGNVTFVARVGNDAFGRQSIDLYKKEGINTSFITTDPTEPSGVALILVDAKGENCISVAASANDMLAPANIEAMESVITRGDIVLMQLETPIETVAYAATTAARLGAKVILNPAPARELPDSLFSALYMIIPNETEAEILTGIKISDEASAKCAADKIAARGTENVLITMGALGVFVRTASVCRMVSSYKTAAADTTAAGDTFCGALCVALSEGKELGEAVKFANRAAALSVTRVGAQASIPYRREIDDLVAREGL